MKWIFDLAVAVVALAAGTAVVVAFWPKIRESVAAWLRTNGLAESALMDAWVVLDRVATLVRSRIYVRTAERGEVVIEDRYLTDDELKDPVVQAMLASRQTAVKHLQFA